MKQKSNLTRLCTKKLKRYKINNNTTGKIFHEKKFTKHVYV